MATAATTTTRIGVHLGGRERAVVDASFLCQLCGAAFRIALCQITSFSNFNSWATLFRIADRSRSSLTAS